MFVTLFFTFSDSSLFLFILCLLVFTLTFLSVLLEKDRFLRLAVVFRTAKREKIMAQNMCFPFLDKHISENKEKEDFVLPNTKIDAAEADSLLSDGMAKNLIHRAKPLKVFGNKKRIINLGELSRAFSDGERVDINRMKAVGLLPYDTLKVKVLASGALDKKLYILANGFSKTAVKMIALSGGEAIITHSVRARMPKIDG